MLYLSGSITHQLLYFSVIDCGDLEPPDNGDVDLSGTGLGSLANYSCDPLHSLVGSETRTCMENGEWMPGAPVCERKLKLESRVIPALTVLEWKCLMRQWGGFPMGVGFPL